MPASNSPIGWSTKVTTYCSLKNSVRIRATGLLELAVAEGRVMVAIDTDFGELVFPHGVAHAGLVRLPDATVVERVASMREIPSRHGDALSRRAVITAGPQRFRITTPPQRPRP